jgi:hypothetical protein
MEVTDFDTERTRSAAIAIRILRWEADANDAPFGRPSYGFPAPTP